VNSTKRTLAVASAMVVAGTLVSVAPAATTSAEAGTVKVRKPVTKQRLAARGRVVKVARAKVGKRYVRGGTGPGAFDCSGLVYYTYKRTTGKTLPRTAAGQNYGTRNVNRKNLKRGDLVFFNGNGHVAIYVGRNKIVHATNPNSGVRVDSLKSYWGPRINGYGRVIVKS
jgi:cell wall-associated NlpC family hydrolase